MKTIAFFSFKGGVGRTALLLSLGTWWASRGKVVALMDLDLTAPGLSYSPAAGAYLYPQGEGLGMADLLAAYQQGDPGREEGFELLPPHLLLRELGEPADMPKGPGRLLLIGAGERPFVETPARPHGPIPPLPPRTPPPEAAVEERAFAALAEAARDDLGAWTLPAGPAAGRGIDYLLIDTRTGFAELIGLGLGLLADKRVLVSGLNEQNLHGLRLTLEALLPTLELDTLPVALTLVFSPLPAGEDETVLARLEEAHRQVADCLRYTRAGRREQAPPSFPLHYTPLLAVRDAPLVLRHPKALYSREVQAMARHLEGAAGIETEPDELMQAARREAMRLVAPPPPAPRPPEVPGPRRPHPLADLPAWHWPLDALGRGEEAEARLEALVRPGEGVELDPAGFLDRIAWSSSLTLPEKRAVLESMPRLAQGQVDQLTEILDTERRAFMAVWEKPTNRRGLLRLMLTVQKVWAELLLEDPDKADRLTLDTPLEGECPVPHWRHWPEYWLVLAHRLLDRTDRLPQALEAVDRALEAGAEPAQLAEDLLQGLDPAALPAHRLEAVEAKARALAPDDPWLGYYLARNRLAGPSPDKATARALLEPLLKDPPAQGRRCFELVALVLDNLPDLAPDTETASRRAVELEPDYAPGWNTLGNLLQSHLARYEEAEAAYRKAVELDPEYASPWNGLGLLQLYARGDCKAAVEAFEHGLALGEDDAAPYLRMNLAHTRLCTGQDPAEACPLLAEALAGFLAEPGYQSNRLRLALELGDEAEAARQVEAAQTQWEHSRDYDAAYALLLQACCHPDREPPEAAWERCRQAMASHDERFATLSELHLLAGLRPEARQAARELAGRLLDPDPDWVQGFRDRPGPGARWERFRPFVAGRSKGAGDPADGLCAGD